MRRTRGFTLIELLVALSITALIMAIAYGGLGALSRQANSSRDTMLRLRQVQLAMDILSRDFAQLEPRPVRDGLGSTSPALLAGPSNVPPIEFTRGGWGNPLGTTRSTEERVAYSLEDGKLMRSWWPELDGQAQVVPAKEVLLTDVSSIKFQYMDGTSKSFQDIWPPTQTAPPSAGTHAQAQVGAALPVAVSITVTLKDLGDITRIVEVASCAANCLL
jgi:general secretion pathway protein J